MATIIRFPQEDVVWRQGPNLEKRPDSGESAELLLFTGIRYSRNELNGFAEEMYIPTGSRKQ